MSLCDVEEGSEAEVACLVCAHESRRNTLAVYGLVPGGRIILQQKRPSYVVRVGETELALETTIAREIFVKAPPGVRTAGVDARPPDAEIQIGGRASREP